MWLRFARCVARSVIVVAGKFASILICGLAAELRNSQPQSVFGLTKKSRKPFVDWTVCGEEYFATGRSGLMFFWLWPTFAFRGKYDRQMCILACGLYIALASVCQNPSLGVGQNRSQTQRKRVWVFWLLLLLLLARATSTSSTSSSY